MVPHVLAVAFKFVKVEKEQLVPGVKAVAVVGSSFEGGSITQIPNVPLLLFPSSQKRTYTVEAGVKLVAVIVGIPVPLSLQLTSVKVPQGAPVYSAIPPSVITPAWELIISEPVAGTTILNHTSLPIYPAHPGAGMVPQVLAVAP